MRAPKTKLATEGKMPVTKIEAAVRQLEVAITLWFFDGDPVSTCTLIFAAHEILYQLSKNRRKHPSQMDAENVVPTFKNEYLAIVKEGPNFFKHSGKDPGEVHYLAVKNNQLFLLDAIVIYNGLGFGMNPIFRTIQTWLWISQPNLFVDKFVDLLPTVFDIQSVLRDGKSAFFSKALPIYTKTGVGIV